MKRFYPTAAQLFERMPRIVRRHRLIEGWITLTGEDPIQLVRIRNQSFGYADMRDGFQRLIVIDGNFESEFFAVADALLCKGGVFLDVGAHFGLLSCGLAGQHGSKIQFHLFEPNEALLESIHRGMARQPAVKYRINCAAVTDVIGQVFFQVDQEQTGASRILREAGQTAASITIDNYLEKENIGSVTLLKLDIEGCEILAIRGAARSLRSRLVQAIYFEYFEKNLIRFAAPRELIEQFDAFSYQVCFCKKGDLAAHGGGTHTIRNGLPGSGIALRPVKGDRLPSMTDLIALPIENLTTLGS